MRAAHLFAPLVKRLPPETAHRAAILSLKLAPPRSAGRSDPRLAVSTLGLSFPNPLGLAAGFDKNAEVPGAMLALGFGFVEVGTLTPRPQPGNARPRLFRLREDGAVINRLGFNNEGYDNAAAEAGRTDGAVRVVAAVPVSVTDDVETVRAQAAEQFAMYGQLPSYRAMLDHEGYRDPQDAALIGEENLVTERIDELRDAGVDEFVGYPFDASAEGRARTRKLLREYGN